MATQPSETITLRNGTEAEKPLVAAITNTLTNLLNEQPIAFYELVRICREPGYTPFGAAGEPLLRLGLARIFGSTALENGLWEVHEAIREIVLASVEGEGSEIRLISPVVS